MINLNEIGIQLQARNEQALSDLITNYRYLVIKQVYQYLKCHEDTEEVVNDIFIKVWNKAEKWDPDKGMFSSWFFTVVRNTALDKARHVRRVKQALDIVSIDDEATDTLTHPDNHVSMLSKLITNETAERLESSIAFLDRPLERITLYLRYFEGYKLREVARILNMSVGGVKITLHRACRKLRNILQDKNNLHLPDMSHLSDQKQAIKQALKQINSAKQVRCFRLYYFKNMSGPQISEVTGIPKSSINYYVKSCRNTLYNSISAFDVKLWCKQVKAHPMMLR